MTANISEVFSAQMDSMNFAMQSFATEQDEIQRFWQSASEHKEVFIMPPDDFVAPVVEARKPTTTKRINIMLV